MSNQRAAGSTVHHQQRSEYTVRARIGRRNAVAASAVLLLLGLLAAALGLQAQPAGATGTGWQVSATFAPQLTPETTGGLSTARRLPPATPSAAPS